LITRESFYKPLCMGIPLIMSNFSRAFLWFLSCFLPFFYNRRSSQTLRMLEACIAFWGDAVEHYFRKLSLVCALTTYTKICENSTQFVCMHAPIKTMFRKVNIQGVQNSEVWAGGSKLSSLCIKTPLYMRDVILRKYFGVVNRPIGEGLQFWHPHVFFPHASGGVTIGSLSSGNHAFSEFPRLYFAVFLTKTFLHTIWHFAKLINCWPGGFHCHAYDDMFRIWCYVFFTLI